MRVLKVVFTPYLRILQTLLVFASFTLLVAPTNGLADQFELEFDGFTVLFDCELHGAVKFEYLIKKDEGNLPRKSSFTLDGEHELPEGCQQSSSKSYKHSEFSFDRGHLVPANHLDHLKKGIKQSNYMTNILPQARTMNRGAWKLTEEITECYRDIENLQVIGGVIWGDNPDDDFFVESHSVATPDYFWKVIEGKQRLIAWLVPNSHGATRSRLDLYLTSVARIEELIDEKIDVPNKFKNLILTKSWKLPRNCDKG